MKCNALYRCLSGNVYFAKSETANYSEAGKLILSE
jgi:hypothetical protein